MGVATAVTVGSMAISAVGASKQRKAAKKAAAAQEAAMNEATEEQRRQYEEKKALYGPIEEKLVAEAKSDVPLAYTRQAQEIEKQVSEAQRGLLGRPYGSGALRSTQENLLLREAEAKAGAYGSALDQQRAMRMQLTQFNPSNQLGAQYADAMNKKSVAMADMYGQQRKQAEAAEGAAWQSAIQGAGQVAGDIDKYMMNRPQIGSTTATTNMPSEDIGKIEERDTSKIDKDITNPYGNGNTQNSQNSQNKTEKEDPYKIKQKKKTPTK